MLRKRVVATAIIIFVLGVVFGIVMSKIDTFEFRAILACVAFVSVAFVVYSARLDGFPNSKFMIAAALAVAAFSLGALRVSLHNYTADFSNVYAGKDDSGIFEITEINENSVDVRVVESTVGVPNGKKIRIYLDEKYDFFIGDRFSANVMYKLTDSEQHYAKGLTLSATAEIIEHKYGEGLIYNIRKSLSESSDRLFSMFEHASPIAKGVTIGDRSDIDSYTFSVYKTLGVSHVLSISGMHLSLIVMAFNALLSGLRLGRRWVNGISILFSVLYTLVAGFTPGVVRSAIMMIVLMISRMFVRKSDQITALFVALAILIVINPYSICSAGLQLSFACTLGILLSQQLWVRFRQKMFAFRLAQKGIKGKLVQLLVNLFSAVLVTMVSTVFSFPILFLSFDTVSWISPIANLLIVPFFSFAVGVAFFAIMVGAFLPSVGAIIAYPAGLIFDFVTDLAVEIYKLDFSNISVHQSFMIVPFAISLFLICMLCIGGFNHRRTALFFATMVCFCVSIVVCDAINSAKRADTAILEYGRDKGEYLYICGNNVSTYVDIGGYSSEPDAVFKNGMTHIDDYVILQYDSFSLSRFEYISGTVSIDRIYVSRPVEEEETALYMGIKALSTERNCDIIFLDDAYEKKFADFCTVYLFHNESGHSDGTMLVAEVGDKDIHFFGNGYDNFVDTDFAVAMNGNVTAQEDINADKIYFLSDGNEYEDSIVTFDKCLRIEYDNSESDFSVYEP